MAITPQHPKGEPTEADLQNAYGKARSIGLFLVEKYARQILHEKVHLREFLIDEEGAWGFVELHEGSEVMRCWPRFDPLYRFMREWEDLLQLTSNPMRFTATGSIRREW